MIGLMFSKTRILAGCKMMHHGSMCYWRLVLVVRMDATGHRGCWWALSGSDFTGDHPATEKHQEQFHIPGGMQHPVQARMACHRLLGNRMECKILFGLMTIRAYRGLYKSQHLDN
jgi:hypothetical protein